MFRFRLILILLFVVCFSLATYLQPTHEVRDRTGGRSDNVLAILLGDGRKMVANQMFARADAYFHRGNYPSIFDVNPRKEKDHMIQETGDEEPGEHLEEEHAEHDHSDHKETDKSGVPQARDWIEAFGQHFYPTAHAHLRQGDEREILPWLRFSAELDPHRVETYTVAAYWLRDRLGKVNEAEEFLREGLRANPNDPAILNELARLYGRDRKDYTRARNVFVVALRRWQEIEGKKEKPDLLLLEQILGNLASVEKQQGHLVQAIEYLRRLKTVSPRPEAIQKQIDELTAQIREQSHN
jgi:tetratricopeptide (TPR) repeat protein